jgi:hypothetical protein
MAWNTSKPSTSGYIISAEHRANWTALERSLAGCNLMLDPTFVIWAAETGGDGAAAQTNPPTHYTLSGTGATVRRCGASLGDTTTYGLGNYACLLTYGSATAYLGQTLFATLPTAWRGQDVSAAAWIKSSTANAARLRINDGVGSSYSPYHPGDATWDGPSESIVVTRTLDAAATTLKLDLELTSGSAYVEGMMFTVGPIPPVYFIPGETVHGMLYFPTASIIVGTQKGTWAPARPGIVKHTQIYAKTVPTGAALIIDVNTWDGAAFTSMYSTKPQLAISGAHGGAAPDTTYARRCYSGTHGTATQAGGLVTWDCDQRGSTIEGADIAIEVKCIQFRDPLEAWRTN